jgi:hypothetical protein
MLFVKGKAPMHAWQLFSVPSTKTISMIDVTTGASDEVDCGEVG